MNVKEIEIFLKTYLSDEPRQDSEFRYAIAANQFGSLGNHMTHDPALNPRARPHQTKEGEKGDFGHAILQLMMYGISRSLPVAESIGVAQKALEDKDWIIREGKADGKLKGLAANLCMIQGGFAYVDPTCRRLNMMPEGSVLVASHPNAVSMLPHIHKLYGIITDQGGMTCHAAIVAREKGIPCIVGTGNATKFISQGQWVTMEENGTITIYKAKRV